jgi:DNA-directed RNA polymerase alpha subunit
MALNSYHPISRLNLSSEVIRRLQEAGIKKIGGLRKATREDLECIPYIGTTRIIQIEEALHDAGITKNL